MTVRISPSEEDDEALARAGGASRGAGASLTAKQAALKAAAAGAQRAMANPIAGLAVALEAVRASFGQRRVSSKYGLLKVVAAVLESGPQFYIALLLFVSEGYLAVRAAQPIVIVSGVLSLLSLVSAHLPTYLYLPTSSSPGSSRSSPS